MVKAKHAAESAKKATVKKAAIATAVAAATMLTGANAAIAAPAKAQNCTPNKDDVAKQQKAQNDLASAKAGVETAEDNLTAAKKAADEASKKANKAAQDNEAAKKAQKTATDNLDKLNNAKAKHDQAKAALDFIHDRLGSDQEIQAAKDDADAAAKTAQKASDDANNALTAADDKVKDANDKKNDAVKAQKAAEAVLAAIKVRENCVVPSNPSTPAKPAAKTDKGMKVVEPAAAKKEQGGLAQTGADSLAAVAAAVVLLSAGTGLVASRRRD